LTGKVAGPVRKEGLEMPLNSDEIEKEVGVFGGRREKTHERPMGGKETVPVTKPETVLGILEGFVSKNQTQRMLKIKKGGRKGGNVKV